MDSTNELGSNIWEAVKLAVELVWGIGRSITNMETDPTIKGLMVIFFIMVAPFAMLVAALIAIIWFLIKKAFDALQG